MTYSLETDAPQAKKMYEEEANRIENVLKSLESFLKE